MKTGGLVAKRTSRPLSPRLMRLSVKCVTRALSDWQGAVLCTDAPMSICNAFVLASWVIRALEERNG